MKFCVKFSLQLDSADPRIRISTSGAISALFGDVQSDLQFTEDMNNQYKANLDMILNSQLLKTIKAIDNVSNMIKGL